ncbi:MAG: hypothetical protein NT020_08710 [Chloroflexales bacterium]|nr:hypothetical protein [Chloroflexales bacterium]
MNKPLSINDSWKLLFARHAILDHVAQYGSFEISARQINTVREARLMAKFDESHNLPPIFRSHNLTILPISRGSYTIGPYTTFQTLDYADHTTSLRPIRIPTLDTLQAHDIHSEAEALLFLRNSGVWSEICGDTQVYSTLQGRRASGQFQFTIARTTPPLHATITVDNAQIEIDAGYETSTQVFLCEAKNRPVSELNIRQLYYPYRFAQTLTPKPIIPLSVIYSNYTFFVTRFTVNDPHDFNSLTVSARYAYTIDTTPLTFSDLALIWHQTQPALASAFVDIPFPQADNLLLVIYLVKKIASAPLTTNEITEFLGYDKRQSDYYASASRWLGLIDSNKQITQLGTQFIQATPHNQKIYLIKSLFATPFFYDVAKVLISHHVVPSKEFIFAQMQTHPQLGAYNNTTQRRRANTVFSWLRWVTQQLHR